jgi:hypothetical protein
MGTPVAKKKAKLPSLSFSSNRRFGVELEVNAFDKKSRPDPNKRVAGIEAVAREVAKFCEQGVEIREWEHTQKNDKWVVKPDSSCGMEIVTPPLKGWRGLLSTCRVVEGISKNPEIEVDHRCSVHVHIEVADLTDEQLASVICHWIKCEPVFMDMMPPERKRNRYCQFIGLSNKIKPCTYLSPKRWMEEVGDVKYYSFNCNQMRKSNYERKTIEVRIAEAGGCKDAYLIKNWVRLLIHFIEMCKTRPIPHEYKEGKAPLTNGLCWLDPEDVLTVLGFNNNPHQYELSNGLTQTRNWMLARLMKNLAPHTMPGMPRYIAWKQLQDILARFKEEDVEIRMEDHLSPTDLADALYSENFKY